MSPFGDTRIFPSGNIMAHDCWFCRTMRVVTAGGFLAMAAVVLVDWVGQAYHKHWLAAGKGFGAMAVCLVMIPVSQTALKLWQRTLDRVIPDGK